jgi:hypothetical protein
MKISMLNAHVALFMAMAIASIAEIVLAQDFDLSMKDFEREVGVGFTQPKLDADAGSRPSSVPIGRRKRWRLEAGELGENPRKDTTIGEEDIDTYSGIRLRLPKKIN